MNSASRACGQSRRHRHEKPHRRKPYPLAKRPRPAREIERRAASQMPTSTNGTHYFAARETESAFVRAHDATSTNLPVQLEKFLFYRGTGDFKTPLTVTTTDDGSVSVSNTARCRSGICSFST